MADTDDKKSIGSGETSEINAEIASEEPSGDNSVTEPKSGKSTLAVELVAVGVKAVAVALSVIVLIVSILTVAMPLSAMRVFNDLGMSERALNSGTRYIERRLSEYDALDPDELGQFGKAAAHEDLSDADMNEALEVCINLSYELMNENVHSDRASAEYFATELDRLIRIYLSRYGANNICDAKSAANVAAVSREVKPFVYDYMHTLMNLDFAARVYTGKTDEMIYDSNKSGEFMTGTAERSLSLSSYDLSKLDVSVDRALIIMYLDWFVDYVDQLGTYLSIAQNRLGVTDVLSQTETQNKYMNVLKGDEFSLFVTAESGFTALYTQLRSMFSKYAQLAVDFDARNVDDMLHKLYWVRILTDVSNRLWNMGLLTNYNHSVYGIYSKEVYDEWGGEVYHYYRFVDYGGSKILLSDVYSRLAKEYYAFFD